MNEGTDEEKEELKQALSNARKQSSIPTLAGQLGTNVALYGVGSKAMQAIPAISNLTGKMGNAVGKKAGEVAKEAGKNIGTNLAFNVGGEVLGAATKNLIPELKKIENAKKISNTNTVNDNSPILKTPETSMVEVYSSVSNIDGSNSSFNAQNGTNKKNDILIGEATMVKAKYTGTDTLPEQKIRNNERLALSQKSIDNARINLDSAEIDSKLNSKGRSTILGKVYETLFDYKGIKRKDVPVNGLTINGEPYVVTVNKNAISKIMSEQDVDYKKLAVLDDLYNVIQKSNYVGSADYVNYKNKKPNVNTSVKRYNYFETHVGIEGKDHIVSFAVAVEPDNNKYRTHTVIDEIKLRESNGTDTATIEAGAPNANGVLFNNSISNTQKNVNSKSKTTAPKGKLILYPAILRKFILFTFSLKIFQVIHISRWHLFLF